MYMGVHVCVEFASESTDVVSDGKMSMLHSYCEGGWRWKIDCGWVGVEEIKEECDDSFSHFSDAPPPIVGSINLLYSLQLVIFKLEMIFFKECT